MKYKDHQMLEEAYSKIEEKQNLEEGILDRLKGTVSGVKKAASWAPETLNKKEKFFGKGGVVDELKRGYTGGKTSSVIRSHVEKLNNQIDDFFNDLKKVGNPTENSLANFDQTATFLKGIIKKIASTSGKGQASVSGLKHTLGKAGFLHPSEKE